MRAKPIVVWLGAAAILTSLPFVGAKLIQKLSTKEWEEVEAQAKAAGVALTPEEALSKYQAGPDSENAAEGVKVVLRTVLKTPKAGSNEFQPGWKPEYDEALKAVQAELRASFKSGRKLNVPVLRRAVLTFDKPLEEFEIALEKPNWNFKRDWSQGMAMLMPDLARIKGLSQLLHAKALVAAVDGNEEVAIRSIQSIFRLGKHLRSEPSMIGLLVGVSCQQMGYNAALNTARLFPTNGSLISKLQRAVEVEIEPVDWRLLWQTDQTMMLMSLDSFTSKEGLKEFGLKEEDHAAIRSKREMLRTKASIVRLLIQAEKAWQGKPTSAEASIQISKSYEKAITDLYANYHEIYVKLGVGDVPNNFERLPEIIQRLEATRRLTWLALMTVRQGPVWKLPAEATFNAWSDPFSGSPMKLKATKSGFRIYSVGSNKKDDGGTNEQSEGESKLDEVLSFPFRD